MERRRDREMERRRDGETERRRALFLSVSLSLCLSVFMPPRLPASGQRLEWSAQSSGALAKLSGVFFVDRDHGWIAGSNGTMLVTEEGGEQWLSQKLP